MRMRLKESEALQYCERQGFPLSTATYWRDRRKVNKLKLDRLYLIAAQGFEDQHLVRIDNCELIEKLMWENYERCEDPHKKVMILKEIKELQPYISSYYEATKEVVKPAIARQEDTSLPENTTQAPTNNNEWV